MQVKRLESIIYRKDLGPRKETFDLAKAWKRCNYMNIAFILRVSWRFQLMVYLL